MMLSKKILTVDDDALMGEVLSDILNEAGYHAAWAGNGADAIRHMAQDPADVVLLDLLLPGIDGLEVLRRLIRNHPLTPVIMMSGHGTIQSAVEATRQGAYAWMEKPLEKERVLLMVRNALEKQTLVQEKNLLLSEAKERYRMVGTSPHLRGIYRLIDRVAPMPSTVLITGESGTGKELVARAIHINSARAAAPLVQVNCAAVPESLIESELFGYEKGAFTGAGQSRKGRFQQAHGGTLFLDEIGDLSAMAQAKVLRAIESGEVVPVGSDSTVTVDVRLITATNCDLQAKVHEGLFREDLYHRINVIELALTPLRQRTEDIPPLLEHFLQLCAEVAKMPPKRLLPEALTLCLAYGWPGNVRELRNLTEKICVLVDGDTVTAADVRHLLSMQQAPQVLRTATLREAKRQFEREFILEALGRHHWNVARTAETLDMPRSLLYQKIDRYGLVKPP